MLSGRCYCHLVLSGVIPLGSCVAEVMATMADGIAIFPTFRLMLLPMYVLVVDVIITVEAWFG